MSSAELYVHPYILSDKSITHEFLCPYILALTWATHGP